MSNYDTLIAVGSSNDPKKDDYFGNMLILKTREIVNGYKIYVKAKTDYVESNEVLVATLDIVKSNFTFNMAPIFEEEPPRTFTIDLNEGFSKKLNLSKAVDPNDDPFTVEAIVSRKSKAGGRKAQNLQKKIVETNEGLLFEDLSDSDMGNYQI